MCEVSRKPVQTNKHNISFLYYVKVIICMLVNRMSPNFMRYFLPFPYIE